MKSVVSISRKSLFHYIEIDFLLDQVTFSHFTFQSASGSPVEDPDLSDGLEWEEVKEGEATMTLWVPDHAVTHCDGCHTEFSITHRHHHCRYSTVGRVRKTFFRANFSLVWIPIRLGARITHKKILANRSIY